MCCSPSVFDWEQTFPSAMCNGSLMAPSRHRPELDDPPVAVMVNVWGSCWQFFTLGVASSFGTWWRCVIVLVGILVANYFAILAVQLTGFCFELADAAKDSLARLLMPENKGFTTTEKLTNCFGWVWCASWCWPEVSVVSMCLLWMIQLRECLPTAVLCWRIWFESLDLNWWGHKADPNQHDVWVIHDVYRTSAFVYLRVLLQLRCLRRWK